ncbi:MAG: [FeFe] hydrogenase H-cluster radical SAM maturase HydE [Victivallales bacterium]|nr:[FeFe] hydrogenase H-cluster radical SAM maturase HydE [Victivallales bacterium]
MQNIIDKIRRNVKLAPEELRQILETEDSASLRQLFSEARRIKQENLGNKVYLRGIIEFSNICSKNCFYCGIRKGNKQVSRFRMDQDKIVELALWALENRYGSVVIQGGERESGEFTGFIAETVARIKNESGGKLGITLSLGEQAPEVYERWFQAGAHRYLLRIETSNEKLYRTLHPADHSFKRRRQCLECLRDIGYQTGTGVMIGLPGQTSGDLVNDILFFERENIDMLGMGPYIIHNETPLAKRVRDFNPERQLNRGLKMIAACRIYLRDVNIAAATALQALDPRGREKGVQAGANVIMPNITDTGYRPAYQLYNGKPCLDENSDGSKSNLEHRLKTINAEIAYDEWGDSPHFFKRQKPGTGGSF